MKQVKPMSATVTIRRPNGDIETVDASKYGAMSQTLADKISAATNAAGKGVVIAWTFTPAEYEKTTEEIAREADLADYYKSNAATKKAMSY